MSTKMVDSCSVLNLGLYYATKLMWGYPAKTDANQTDVLRAIKRDYTDPYGHVIKVVHSDSGSVFLSAEVKKYCLKHGISEDVSAPYSHQHNLVEGSCIRVILNRASVLLADAGLPARFAGYAVQDAISTWNQMLHPVEAPMTPFERVTGEKPDISGNRPFGAVCFYFNTKKERDQYADPRWGDKASKGILLGSAPGVEGGYLVYPGRNRKVLVRKQVIAMEAKVTAALPCYSDRYRLGDQLVAEEETIPQADQRSTEGEGLVPVAKGTRLQARPAHGVYKPPGATNWAEAPPTEGGDYWDSSAVVVSRSAAGVGSRRRAVEVACAAAGATDESAQHRRSPRLRTRCRVESRAGP
jgi:hypothetical protein